jgi:hypothetical protein
VVNRLIAECEDLEHRFDLRNEIMRAGMSEVMADQVLTVMCGVTSHACDRSRVGIARRLLLAR